jgi:CheY-like chemotaxis protein
MLRDLVTVGMPAQDGAVVVVAAPKPLRERPRLLVVHNGDRRVAALESVLGEIGYRATVVAGPEEAIAAIARGPMPDVLIVPRNPAGPRRGLAFPRECLSRWPSLRALYIMFIPRPVPDALVGRERVLAAPFNADQLAAALAALWPVEADIIS